MDGASYHKRLTNPTPSESWLKADIRQWLADRGSVLYYSQPKCIFNVFLYLEIHYEEKDVISQLLVRVQPHRPTPMYAEQVIATKHDHLVFFTPPYHPELQPIELMWELMKNHIAADPATNAKDLDKKVKDKFSKVSDENWTKYYRHVQKFEDEYATALDDCCLVSDNESEEEDQDDGANIQDENDACSEDDEVVIYSF
ncbi:hypothetical protein PHMEG_00019867 [Phytophthora megakarya]|uniref:Tc1-like transposase DDE domain-containing protein n=1 Tax=Phytophthora megakarya TaxID=4795 RepID=A0A225VT57_9STRA|nr:hypothetical protein PHMEG_00019867 [Phytophthora megakarya]